MLLNFFFKLKVRKLFFLLVNLSFDQLFNSSSNLLSPFISDLLLFESPSQKLNRSLLSNSIYSFYSCYFKFNLSKTFAIFISTFNYANNIIMWSLKRKSYDNYHSWLSSLILISMPLVWLPIRFWVLFKL